MNIGNFFQLQRAFESNGIINVPAHINKVVVPVEFPRNAITLRVSVKSAFHVLREALQFAQRLLHGGISASTHLRYAGREQEQHGKLSGKTLSSGDSDFLARMGEEGGVSFFGEGRLRDITDGQR